MNPLIFASLFFLQAPSPAPVAVPEQQNCVVLTSNPPIWRCEPAPLLKVDKPKLRGARFAMYSAAVLDVGSTFFALESGAHERNPLLGRNPSAPKLIGLKAAGVALNDIAGRYLLRKGKVGQAKFVYWFSAGVWFLASALNFGVINW